MNPDQQTPFFSIGIPTYERSIEYLRGSIRSVLSQEFEDFELLVSDNHSTRDTARQVCSQIDDPRLRLVVQPMSLGMAGNWSYLVQHAMGTWTSILHDDDEMTAGALERTRRCIQEHPAVDLVASVPIEVTADTRTSRINPHFRPPSAGTGPVDPRCFMSGALKKHANQLSAPSVFVRSTVYKRHIPFSRWPVLTTDLNMWLRILSEGRQLAILSEPGVRYRIHDGQDTWRHKRHEYFFIAFEYLRAWRAFSTIDRLRILVRLVRGIRYSTFGSDPNYTASREAIQGSNPPSD